jgi:hypothetical protein
MGFDFLRRCIVSVAYLEFRISVSKSFYIGKNRKAFYMVYIYMCICICISLKGKAKAFPLAGIKKGGRKKKNGNKQNFVYVEMFW